MHRTPAVTLSAVTIVAALGVAGCAHTAPPAASPNRQTSAVAAAPSGTPLPSPDALTGVISRLADTSIPAEQKVGLVQYATVDDQAVLTNFGEALKANGFVPLTVVATDLAWSSQPGNVLANVTLSTADPAVKPFTYPMEFAPIHDAWQLTQRTADQLLPLAGTPTTTPSS
ncbi:hypothetical protein CIW52_34570 [Mycolicibacterium sp. P9-64]|uniref:hypothetical protein n=1 Tax=Mycolicibacterium sp. P9-64 TaxID=2024612 RepID=UPI0011F027F2|nr:hypothetical protein [Mycolicibacterium sp. P9-64]KAA0074287.1 hypothetical protein CIW52_34570 [Mycolicibacterium sp. P9-64]